MGKFILFTLSCIYLIVEYFFNVNLINMLGNDSVQNYLDVDVIGRSVSAVGGTLLAFRFILLSKKNILFKSILSLIISPIIFYVIFVSQELAVDYITKYTDDDVKKNQTYTYIYKKGVISSGVDFNKIPRESKGKSKEDYVFFASVSFWGFGYHDFIKMAENNPIIFLVIILITIRDIRKQHMRSIIFLIIINLYRANMRVRWIN